MTGATTGPCADLPPRPSLVADQRIRVTQVLATGSNGGAQEYVRSLVERIDPHRYDVDVVSLTDGPTIRRMTAAGVAVTVLDEGSR